VTNKICKTCILCEHMHYSSGDHGYSEYTPGYTASISCSKGHWDIDTYMDSDDEVRDKMQMAETCPGFLHYKDAQKDKK